MPERHRHGHVKQATIRPEATNLIECRRRHALHPGTAIDGLRHHGVVVETGLDAAKIIISPYPSYASPPFPDRLRHEAKTHVQGRIATDGNVYMYMYFGSYV